MNEELSSQHPSNTCTPNLDPHDKNKLLRETCLKKTTDHLDSSFVHLSSSDSTNHHQVPNANLCVKSTTTTTTGTICTTNHPVSLSTLKGDIGNDDNDGLFNNGFVRSHQHISALNDFMEECVLGNKSSKKSQEDSVVDACFCMDCVQRLVSVRIFDKCCHVDFFWFRFLNLCVRIYFICVHACVPINRMKIDNDILCNCYTSPTMFNIMSAYDKGWQLLSMKTQNV